MCARYSYSTRKIREVMLAMSDLRDLTRGGIRDKINHTPNTAGPVVLDRGGEHRLEAMTWGLLTSWQPTKPVVNAKSETVMEKRTFASSVHRRRCLVITDAFYEWETVGRRKLPWEFSLTDRQPLVMAGIWNLCNAPDGTPTERYCILTTSANDTVQRCHHRMPVILAPKDWRQWIDPANEAEQLKHLWQPWSGPMNARQVSPRINNVSFQDGSIELDQAPTNTDEPIQPVQGELF